MKMRKVLALLLIVAVVATLAVTMTACSGGEFEAVALEDIKVGLICLHGQSSTYDKNFIDAMEEARVALGLREDQIIIKTDIPESAEAYTAAADLVAEGCNIIFADSFGHEEHIIRAAKDFPEVQFCHATGTKAHTEQLPNYANAFAAIYEGRYVAGIAAGMKLNQMIQAGTITAAQAKMGYVGAFPYAEVKSGYTSFYLGAKSVCPSVTMDVTFTNSWFSESMEKDGANALIARGCVLISQHADSMGAPSACETAGVPNVSYNGSTKDACPNTFIVSSRINWAPYYQHAIEKRVKGDAVEHDWTGTIETGSVVLTDVNTAAAAPGTQEAVNAAVQDLKDGKINVFDCANWKKAGAEVTTYKADVDDFGDFQGETEVIIDGVFEESYYRSAPYFDIDIDGITIIG